VAVDNNAGHSDGVSFFLARMPVPRPRVDFWPVDVGLDVLGVEVGGVGVLGVEEVGVGVLGVEVGGVDVLGVGEAGGVNATEAASAVSVR
jgi:hypothetical protein